MKLKIQLVARTTFQVVSGELWLVPSHVDTDSSCQREAPWGSMVVEHGVCCLNLSYHRYGEENTSLGEFTFYWGHQTMRK